VLVVLQVGWVGLKSLYANVASTVESVAKEQGYRIDLGSKAVATSLEQQRFEQQLRANGGYSAYGSNGDDSGAYGSNGAGGYGSHGVHKSASEGTRLGGGQQGAGGYGGPGVTAKSNGNSNGFAGFDDGADGESTGNNRGSRGGVSSTQSACLSLQLPASCVHKLA
jgi:hypothetical protein